MASKQGKLFGYVKAVLTIDRESKGRDIFGGVYDYATLRLWKLDGSRTLTFKAQAHKPEAPDRLQVENYIESSWDFGTRAMSNFYALKCDIELDAEYHASNSRVTKEACGVILKVDAVIDERNLRYRYRGNHLKQFVEALETLGVAIETKTYYRGNAFTRYHDSVPMGVTAEAISDLVKAKRDAEARTETTKEVA